MKRGTHVYNSQLVKILSYVDPATEVEFEDEFGDGDEITHVKLIDGKVLIGSGYSGEEGFWHPGNGNVTRTGLLLLGHSWPEAAK